MARFGHAASAVALLVALSSSAEGRQVQTDYVYDSLGRLTKVTRQGGTTDYTYDAAGNRKNVKTVQANNPPPPAAYTISIPTTGAYTYDPRGNHTDPDGDTLTITGASASASPKGMVGYSATQVTYTPFANQGGQTDTFTYTVIDGKGGTGVGTVTVNIQAIPVAPTAQAFNVTYTPNAQGDVVNAAVPISWATSGGTPTSITITGSPSGDANISGNSILYSNTGRWSGSTTLTYRGTNATGAGPTATGTIKVVPVVSSVSNIPATAGQQKIVNLAPYAVTTGVTQMDKVGNPQKGTASISGTTLTYTANPGTSGTDTVTYTGTNAGGTSTQANVTFNIQTCSVPVAGVSSATVNYNSESNVIPLSISGGTPTNVNYATGTSHGSVEPIGATMYYSPFKGYYGPDSFTYNATNACGTSNTATVNLTVSSPPNRPPVANPDAVTIAASVGAYGETYAYFDPRLNDTDPDGDPLTLVSVTLPQNGTTWANSNNYVSYVPPLGWSGTDYFLYTISDGRGGSYTSSIQVTVTPPPANHPPTANNGTTEVLQSRTTNVYPLANDTDPDGNPLTIQSIDSFYFAYGNVNGVDLAGPPADIGSVTNNGTYLSYRSPFVTNTGVYRGSYIVVVVWYTASDGRGGTSQAYEVIPVYAPG